jgi:hypothetical protein
MWKIITWKVCQLSPLSPIFWDFWKQLYEKTMLRATQCSNKNSKDKSDIRMLYWLFQLKVPSTQKRGTWGMFLSAYCSQTLPCYTISSFAISDNAVFFKVKMINISETRAKFSLREWQRNETMVAEEYCWAITHTAGQLCCLNWLPRI